MSQPSGIPERAKHRIYKKADIHIPYNNMMLKKQLGREKQPKYTPPRIEELQENSYAISPNVTQVFPSGKSAQQSHPVLGSGKFSKNIIFKRVHKRVKSKETNFFKGRVNSAVRRSSNFKNLDTSGLMPSRVSKKRIKSLSKKSNISIAHPSLQPLNVENNQNSFTIRPHSRGFGSATRKLGKLWNKSPQLSKRFYSTTTKNSHKTLAGQLKDLKAESQKLKEEVVLASHELGELVYEAGKQVKKFKVTIPRFTTPKNFQNAEQASQAGMDY